MNEVEIFGLGVALYALDAVAVPALIIWGGVKLYRYCRREEY